MSYFQTNAFQQTAFQTDYISIERKTGVGGSYAEVYFGPWDGSPWTDTSGFSDGVTYYYRARRMNETGTSDYSTADSVTFSSAAGCPKQSQHIMKMWRAA